MGSFSRIEQAGFTFGRTKRNPEVMKQFFKFTFASMLGTFLTGIILLLIGIAIVSAMIMGAIGSFESKKGTKVEDNSVLTIKFDRPIVDRGGSKRFEFNGPNDFSMYQELGLQGILDGLEQAKHDERIQGVRIELDRVIAGMGTLKEIREKILEFKDSTDKFVWAYNPTYSQRSYYLASAADQVHLYPEGDMSFQGLSSEVTFFKGLLDKLDVDMQIVRGSNNIYKSAIEPFTKKEMSEASREQVSAYLNDLWDIYLSDISDSREIDKGELHRIADSLLIRMPSDAVDHGLIDELIYPDELKDRLRDTLDLEDADEIPEVSLRKYASAKLPDKHREGKDKTDDEEKAGEDEKADGKIGVVYASGAIQGGENEEGVLGARTISKAIRECREDSAIEAVVMRVNSPGGSALASDMIWREVELTLDEKPFVVSMGDVAASGGYYISCAADRIFADPNTITGSIGVFGMIPYTGELFEEHLGISFDRVKTNEHADLMNPNRRLREGERSIIQESVDKIYDDFLARVAEGRDLSKEEVDSLARGRVWSGKAAKENGLVDELGGLEKAIAHASEEADLKDPERVGYPKREDPFKQILSEFRAEAKDGVIDAAFGKDHRFYRKYTHLRSLLDMKGYQAVMPYRIEVH